MLLFYVVPIQNKKMTSLEQNHPSPEQEKPTVSELYEELLELEPKLITGFVPSNGPEQQAAFLAGTIRNPNHQYDKLADIDFAERYERLDQVDAQIMTHPDLRHKYIEVYQQFTANYKNKTHLMELASRYNAADEDEEKRQLGAEFMKLNIEQNGEPDKETYHSLLGETLNKIEDTPYEGQAKVIKEELFELVGDRTKLDKAERFKPSNETIAWMHDVSLSLYDGMLSHVPEREQFSKEEVQQIFTEIINDQFGEAAIGWKVDIEPAKSINVKATEKRIVIPDTLPKMTNEKLRTLVVHEIGVHMLRSVMGGETDLDPLKSGLSDYYEAEEGLGVVMEQAMVGEYAERGIPHYITAGLLYHDQKDFRDAYEIKWRIGALQSLEEGAELTDDAIAKAQKNGYSSVMRFTRGTDDLPWFKDLAYYNGSAHIWKYFEEIRGDDVKFMFTLIGKADPTNPAHEKVLYEVKTI